MGYGWEVYGDNGQVIADDQMFNAFYLDHWFCPANYNNRTVSKTFSYPELRYSKVAVIVGPSSGTIGDTSAISVAVTYPNGVPTVSITETVTDSVSARFGATYWIIATQISRSSPITDAYGIQLMDGSGGVSFVRGLPPLVYAGKGVVTSEAVSGYSDQKGEWIFETWNNVPPVCFWRSLTNNVINIGTIRNETVPYLSSVRKSSKAPTTKNYRWCLQVQFNSTFGSPTDSYNKEVFCFEPYHPAMNGPGTYGIELDSAGLSIVIGTQKPLYLKSQSVMSGAYQSGNNLLSYPGFYNPAITNAPYIMKSTGTYSYDAVFWYTGGNYLRGIHTTQSSGGTNYAGYSPSWWLTDQANTGYESFAIDYTMYV